jgi:hypothetical protein
MDDILKDLQNFDVSIADNAFTTIVKMITLSYREAYNGPLLEV